MKKLLILTSVVSTIAILALMAACQTTGTSGVAQKESLLAQAGFKVKTVTTPKQQQRVSQLPPNVVSAVKYQGKLYYVFSTAKKDQVYVGKQAQYDAYKQALKAKILSQSRSRPTTMLSSRSRCCTATRRGVAKPPGHITSKFRCSMDSVRWSWTEPS